MATPKTPRHRCAHCGAVVFHQDVKNRRAIVLEVSPRGAVAEADETSAQQDLSTPMAYCADCSWLIKEGDAAELAGERAGLERARSLALRLHDKYPSQLFPDGPGAFARTILRDLVIEFAGEVDARQAKLTEKRRVFQETYGDD